VNAAAVADIAQAAAEAEEQRTDDHP
jgi:hypothetical protein